MSGRDGPAPLTNGAPKISVNGSSTPDSEVPMSANDNIRRFEAPSRALSPQQHALFHNKTRCFVYGMQPKAVQGMLDFDFICKRTTPSVAGIIYTFGGQFVSKMYWGTSETLLPVYQSVDKAFEKHPEVDTVVNFASSRSVYTSTMELMNVPQIRSIAIIAEGVPERRAREIMVRAQEKGIEIIGPATVGGIKPGAYKIGNTGGMMDNIVASKLYRKGSVGYVSKSGGMSNELNNIIANNTDGVYEGIAIGGDRYPGTTFIDHLLRYQAEPECKILLLLGEVGGVEEYRVIEAVKNGQITKPIVAWAIGTCASMFKTEVQFGHAGASANSALETAVTKNESMKAAGFHVPDTFEEMPAMLRSVYEKLVKSGNIKPSAEPIVPKIPMDYSWAQELGLIRKPAAFISTISVPSIEGFIYSRESGRVYATGLNDFGQLGISEDRSYTTAPVEVFGLPGEIKQISAGYHHSSAVTVDGVLYMWGKNSSGQLGLGKRAAKVVSVPGKVECLDGVTIKMAALGCDHSIAVTDKGEALSWGGGGSGRLGHGHEASFFGFLRSTSEYRPRLIKHLEGVKVKGASAGMLHSACIDETGSVFIFGERAVEKLGLGEANAATIPSMINKVPCSEDVACGGYHTCVVTSGGELYTWGSNENGCLGIGCTDVAQSPERVQGSLARHPVCKVSCGWKHTAAISEGMVYTWGWGGSHGTFSVDGHSSGGQLGLGNDVDYIEPTVVNFGEKNVKALQVSCGFNHTAAILEYTYQV